MCRYAINVHITNGAPHPRCATTNNIGNNTEFLDSIKGYLNKNFSMKDLSDAIYILGIKIYRDRSRCLIRFLMSTTLTRF